MQISVIRTNLKTKKKQKNLRPHEFFSRLPFATHSKIEWKVT
jgi:hypothetical protein